MSQKDQLELEYPLSDDQHSGINEDSQLLIQRDLHVKFINIINEQKLVIESLEGEINKEKGEKKILRQMINEKDLKIQELGNKQRKLEKEINKQFNNLQTNLQSNLKTIDKMEEFTKQILNEEEENENKEKEKEEEEIKEEKEEGNTESALLSLDISPDQVKINIFNELCLNLQLIVISKIFPEVSNNYIAQYFVNITNMLIYLMQFVPEEMKCLSILAKDADQLLIELKKEEEVNVLYNVTERLFLSNVLESSEFIHHLNQIKSVSIEIKYPSEFYKNIYNKINRLKKTVTTSLDMAIFITGIRCVDVSFRNDKNINIVRMSSFVNEIEYGFILGGAFCYCKSLKKVTISPSVSYIGENVFYGCKALTDITIPPSVKIIGYNAFEDCTSLEEVDIPSSVVEIGSGAFSYCTSLKSFKIPNTVTIIRYNAFVKCAFTQITIPSSILVIPCYTFAGCDFLTDVFFESPSSLKEIEEYAFEACKSLKKIAFPPSLNKVGPNLFKQCSSLEEITIYSTLYDIDKNAFPSNVNIIRIDLFNY